MNIKDESFSDLLNKHTLIIIELSRLNSLMIYYSDCGNEAKLTATLDAVKRLELSKSTISYELDRRIPTNDSSDKLDEFNAS